MSWWNCWHKMRPHETRCYSTHYLSRKFSVAPLRIHFDFGHAITLQEPVSQQTSACRCDR